MQTYLVCIPTCSLCAELLLRASFGISSSFLSAVLHGLLHTPRPGLGATRGSFLLPAAASPLPIWLTTVSSMSFSLWRFAVLSGSGSLPLAAGRLELFVPLAYARGGRRLALTKTAAALLATTGWRGAWLSSCLFVVTSACFFSVEQPGSSLLFYLDCCVSLVACGCALTRFWACSSGSPFKRPSAWFHNKPWLIKLAHPCTCPAGRKHWPVAGSFGAADAARFSVHCSPSSVSVFGRDPHVGECVSRFASICPLPLAHQIASGSRLAKDGLGPVMPYSSLRATLDTLTLVGLGPSPTDDALLELRPFHEDPEWVGELAQSLPFKELLRYRFRERGHINVQEMRTYRTWLKWGSTRHVRSRLLGLIDSRVTLGASAKGRSSSPALCHVLQSTLPYVLGSALYPGGLHVYSGENRADGPSRNRPVDPPSRARPVWLDDLCRGEMFRFDVVTTASRIPKLAARWLRLLLLLGGDIEPHPGPLTVRPRGALDLQAGFAASTRHKMSKCLAAFSEWLLVELNLSLLSVLTEVSAAAMALRAYGLHLYQAGLPRYLLVYAITAVADMKPEFRAHLTPAWQIDKKWQAIEPGECRPVISVPILHAAVSVALLWCCGAGRIGLPSP